MWIIKNSKYSSDRSYNTTSAKLNDEDLSESIKQKYGILFKLEWSRRMCERIL
ncbi:hypothetical protein [Clostridium sp.]|uniref:hypothetical protein n=1 Tax=Clostridium sp. TaxID=1506 RepID=UPI002A915466|nr:hypothetical protein [Clostridium sp.]MDY6012155.1 hypothetical protein [Clostridium sp.]